MKVAQGFEIGDLLEAKGVVVEEFNPGSRPSNKVLHHDSDGFSIKAGEVNSDEVLA